MNKILVTLVAVLVAVPASADQHASAEAEVIETVRAFNNAYAMNDVDAYFGYYADDAEVYFYGRRRDASEYRAEWATIVAMGATVEKNALSDIRVRVMPGEALAVASYFIDTRMRMPNGDLSVSKAFESEVWQKIGGEWKVVNVHYSAIEPEPGEE